MRERERRREKREKPDLRKALQKSEREEREREREKKPNTSGNWFLEKTIRRHVFPQAPSPTITSLRRISAIFL
jgi:hypothetical protein